MNQDGYLYCGLTGVINRLSISSIVLPGTIAEELLFSLPDNAILSTASLNPSAAANVIQSPSISTLHP